MSAGKAGLTDEEVRAVAAEHGLVPLPHVQALSGAASTVYFLSEHVVLRVPHGPEVQFEREASIIPLARAAGVRTPRLIALGALPGQFDLPYMLLERVPGENLGTLSVAPRDVPEVYRELGRDLARWHLREVAPDDPLASLPRDSHDDSRAGLTQIVEQGFLAGEGARWLEAWLDRLAPRAARPLIWRVVHGDARPTNVIVSPESTSYRALLDWGDAHWADPASEFALMPLRAVPFALQGYREVRPNAQEEVSEARVLWYHLGWAIHALKRPPFPDGTWSAPPAGRLLELLRFFAEGPPTPWAALAP